MVDDDNEMIRMAVLSKQLTPNIAVRVRITSSDNEASTDGISTILSVERAILNGLKENDKFLNVEAVSHETGEPIYNFSKGAIPGSPVLETPILVVSVQAVEGMRSDEMVEAPRVYPREKLTDYITYIDDGITKEDSFYATQQHY